MAKHQQVIESEVLVVNAQHADGNVSAYLRGDTDGMSVKLTAAQIPPTRIITPSGKLVNVPTSLTKGTPLYCEVGLLTTLVDSKGVVIGSHRSFQGIISLEPVAAAKPQAEGELE